MPTTTITTSATFQLKDKAGYVTRVAVISPGTTWTLQINDGPSGIGNSTKAVFGATPFTLTAANPLLMNQPLFCSNGIQVVTSGTAGELDIDWY